MMVISPDGCILLCLLLTLIAGTIGYGIGRAYREDDKQVKKLKKLKLIEGIDGVTSVQLTPIRYVELLTKEEECNELKLAIKRFADETPKGT